MSITCNPPACFSRSCAHERLETEASSLTYTISACLVVAANQARAHAAAVSKAQAKMHNSHRDLPKVAWQRATNASKDTFVLSLGCWAAGAVALGLAAALSLVHPRISYSFARLNLTQLDSASLLPFGFRPCLSCQRQPWAQAYCWLGPYKAS